jgi:hypothetical protein
VGLDHVSRVYGGYTPWLYGSDTEPTGPTSIDTTWQNLGDPYGGGRLGPPCRGLEVTRGIFLSRRADGRRHGAEGGSSHTT